MKDLNIVGKSVSRIDGVEKVTGAAIYTDDIDFGPNLLYAAVVESTEAHAVIKKIDTSGAEKLQGVIKVFTGSDFPFRFGLYMKDRHILAQKRVRFVGEQVALVVARDARTALKGAECVKIEYEPLPKVLDPLEAVQDGSDLVHPDLGEYTHVPWFFPRPKTNIAHFRKVRKGDPAQGFSEAEFILEDEYHVPRCAHCCIETHAAVARYNHDGRLTVWASSQSPHTQRHLFAESLAPLGFEHKDIRVISPCVGGGFGGKAGVTMEILAAAAAARLKGYPVKLLWDRAQEFYNTYQRLGVVARLKMGVRKDGTITAMDHTIYWDAGAYVEYGANVVNASGLSAIGPYRIPNVKIDSICVYTNLPPGGPYRGFGYSEFLFGIESHMTRMARRLGLDPVEIRRRNAIKEGDSTAYGSEMNRNGLLEAIDRVEKELEWNKERTPSHPNKAVGKGFALFWKAPAMPANAGSAAFLKFNEDASVNIMISAKEIGQGLLTVIAQIAGEILGIAPEKIRVGNPDTDHSPYEWQTVASHITWATGNAVKKAALDARNQIFDLMERVYQFPKDQLFLENEMVKCATHPDFNLPLRNFVIHGIMAQDGTFKGGPILGHGVFMPEHTNQMSDPETSQGGHPNVHYTVGAAGLILEVDKETGRVKVLKIAEAIDAGKAINPGLVKDQVVGGLMQGLATVLYEDMRFDENGRLLNNNFTDYKIPTAMDIPDEITPIIVEVPQPDGPWGARGVGEHPMLPAAPMVANAVENALGIRITSMPITAEKIAMTYLRHRQEPEDGQ